MKAISIKNPWAYLIVQGIKDIENRTWKTDFRGRILIHSSQTPDKERLFKMFTREQLVKIGQNQGLMNDIRNGFFLNGAIIGSVEIVDCVQRHPSIWAEGKPKIMTDGEVIYPDENKPIWNWVLANPKIGSEYDGYPVKGSLGLWNMDTKRIMSQLTKQKLDEMVDSIKIDRANLEHIAKTGVINGTLLTEIWRVILEGWAMGVDHPTENKTP